MAAARAVRPTAGARRDELEELLQQVRRDLAARDEGPTGAWVAETAAELAAGTKPGWFVPGAGAAGLAFYARRGPAAYGHLHAAPGSDLGPLLAAALLEHLPEDVASLDLGFTGLDLEHERALVAELARRPGSTVIPRQAMERSLTPADARGPAEPPGGLERLPVRALTLEALAELDRASFAGTVDELLLGREPGANRRALEALLDGRLGRFLDEASAAMLEPEPVRLLGAILTTERSTRRAMVVALMVDPSRRRLGLGRFLLGWGLRALWALGYESVRLWVSLANEPAIRLYESFGFRPVVSATIYRWDRPASSAQAQSAR